MPSSPNYKRNYKQEYASEDKTRRKRRSIRNMARQEMIDKGKAHVGDGKDVGHKRALSRGGSGLSLANLAMQSRSSNRSFARNKSGAMSSETSRKERKRKK